MLRLAFALSAFLVVLACGDGPGVTSSASSNQIVRGGATAAARAGQATMQGNWILTVVVPGLGTFPVPCTFHHQDNGNCDFGGTSLPLASRQDRADVATTVEVPKSSSPTGAGFTMSFRVTMTTDNSVSGRAVLLTDISDPASASGFATIVGQVSGQRQ